MKSIYSIGPGSRSTILPGAWRVYRSDGVRDAYRTMRRHGIDRMTARQFVVHLLIEGGAERLQRHYGPPAPRAT